MSTNVEKKAYLLEVKSLYAIVALTLASLFASAQLAPPSVTVLPVHHDLVPAGPRIRICCLAPASPPPAFYIDGVRADASVNFLNPSDIENVRVEKDDASGKVLIRLKAGCGLVPLPVAARDLLDDRGLPVVYLIDGQVLTEPDRVLVGKGFVPHIKAVRMADFSLVLISTPPLTLR